MLIRLIHAIAVGFIVGLVCLGGLVVGLLDLAGGAMGFRKR